MAAKLVTLAQEYLGTDAEKVAMSTTGVKAGSSFYTTDTKKVYIFDGTVWVEM